MGQGGGGGGGGEGGGGGSETTLHTNKINVIISWKLSPYEYSVSRHRLFFGCRFKIIIQHNVD